MPPSPPQGLAVTATQTSLTLSWQPSTDNVGVVGYDLYRDLQPFGKTDSTSATFSGLVCGKPTYTSADFTPDHAGVYVWRATFAGDQDNNSAGPTSHSPALMMCVRASCTAPPPVRRSR